MWLRVLFMDRLIGVGCGLFSCPSVYVVHLTHVHTVQFSYLCIFLASITPKWHERWPPWPCDPGWRIPEDIYEDNNNKKNTPESLPCRNHIPMALPRSSTKFWKKRTKKPIRVWNDFKVQASIIVCTQISAQSCSDSNITNNTLWPSGQTAVFSRHSGFYPRHTALSTSK